MNLKKPVLFESVQKKKEKRKKRRRRKKKLPQLSSHNTPK
jgi:hypothetical protein